MIPKYSGSEVKGNIEEFLERIEAAANMGRWNENDQREVAVLRLLCSAKLFYNGCDKLHEKEANWETFKEAFRPRYREIHKDQYHFTQLQTARQARKESPQQFADRCRSLDQKVMIKSTDQYNRRNHKEKADLRFSEFCLVDYWFSGSKLQNFTCAVSWRSSESFSGGSGNREAGTH